MIAWWSPPKQRQRWGDSQILPSANWGQLFFDLFYVGGAYNLGTLLKETSSAASASSDRARGVLYFTSTGLCVMLLWFDKMYYDARFTTHYRSKNNGQDAAHRLLDVLHIGLVATALSRIRGPKHVLLDNPCIHADLFQFTASLWLSSMITLWRYLEMYLWGQGDPAAKVAAQRDMKWRGIPALLQFIAMMDAGYHYLGSSSFASICQEQQQDDGEYIPMDRPIYWCLTSWIVWAVVGYCDRVLWSPKERLVEMTVPMNVQFCIHRYGEWFMLMLGESVISLLIVDGHNENFHYQVAFYSGILSVMLLAHLHYSAEPHSCDQHALSRSRHSSYAYMVLVPVYSLCLIAIGVSYKMFLYEFTYKYYDDGGSNYSMNSKNYAYYNENNNNNNYNQRDLGDTYGSNPYGGDNGYTNDSSSAIQIQETRQQFEADLFSWSIAGVLVCADLLQLLHGGLHTLLQRARKVSKCALVLFVALKYSLVVGLALLSQFINDPHAMAFSGLGAVLAQECLRIFFFQTRLLHSKDSTTIGDITVVNTEDLVGGAYMKQKLGHSKKHHHHGHDDLDDDDGTCFTTASTTGGSYHSGSTLNDDDPTTGKPRRPRLAMFERELLMMHQHHHRQESAALDVTRRQSSLSKKSSTSSKATVVSMEQDADASIAPSMVEMDYSRMAEI